MGGGISSEVKEGDVLVDWRPWRSWFKCLWAVAMVWVRYFVTSLEVSPGHMMSWFRFIACRNVLIGGEKQAAWRYRIKSLVAVSFLIITLRAGDKMGEWATGEIAWGMGISHNPSPEVLRWPFRTTLSFLMANKLFLFKMTVQLSSQSCPKETRLLCKLSKISVRVAAGVNSVVSGRCLKQLMLKMIYLAKWQTFQVVQGEQCQERKHHAVQNNDC